MSGEQTYRSQSARDAQRSGYGGRRYWDYLEQSAQEGHDYFMRQGEPERAAEQLTRPLWKALQGNDGE